MDSAIISFVPVLHKGYIDFFKKYPGTLYILGDDVLKNYTSVTRDLRVISPADLKKSIEALGIFKQVHILTKKQFKDIQQKKIVMPDDDISRDIFAKYLKGKKIDFEKVFLRWDKFISSAELVVSPGRIISSKKLDQALIGKAIKIGKTAPDWWRQIGALLVKNKKILFAGFNKNIPSHHYMETFGDPRSNFDAGIRIDLVTTIHAEANVIAAAAREGKSLKGCSMYVSTFPCPTCARLITQTGIKTVYYNKGYSILDAETILKSSGVDIVLVKE